MHHPTNPAMTSRTWSLRFSSQTSMLPVTDTYPHIGDNGIDLCVRAEVCPSTKTDPEAAKRIWRVLFDNLRRLAGVSEAGARCRNPDPERSRRGKDLGNFTRLVGMSASETRVLNEANGSRKSLFM